MNEAFEITASACIFIGLAGRVLLDNRQWMRGWYAAAPIFEYPYDLLTHNNSDELFQALWFSYWSWQWWKGGGGDDTKRRLRRLARKFIPARRTAPAPT